MKPLSRAPRANNLPGPRRKNQQGREAELFRDGCVQAAQSRGAPHHASAETLPLLQRPHHGGGEFIGGGLAADVVGEVFRLAIDLVDCALGTLGHKQTLLDSA